MLLFVLVPSFLMAQEKIGNKIYKYGDVYQSIQGPTLIAFDEADAKTMSKTLEYFSKAGAYVKSWNTLFLPGSNVTEDEFSSTLDKNNIETLIIIDIIDSSDAMMSRTQSPQTNEITMDLPMPKTNSKQPLKKTLDPRNQTMI